MTLLYGQLAERILILDGAMGTMLQQKGLTAKDFGGAKYEGCNEILNLTRPALVLQIHEAYLKAGADIIETNSFGATSVILKEYDLADKDIELNKQAATLARQAADKWSTPAKPRFVAGSIGPTTKMLTLSSDITFTELEQAYFRQGLGLLEGGVDLLLIETCQDTLNAKAAGSGLRRAMAETKREVPVIVSCTIEPSGTMLAGQNIEAFYISIKHLKPLAVGLNCGTGAELMNDHLRTLNDLAACAVICYPNAGLPDEDGNYRETPEEFARKMHKFAQNGWLNIAGGCCGTTAEHIAALAEALKDCRPRQAAVAEKSCVSGIEAIWPEEDNRPLLVGERTNVIGSRRFKELISSGQLEEASEIARTQVRKGAQIIDICVSNPDRNELEDMVAFLPYVLKKIKVPVMLDSIDPEVIEAGLRFCQGKAIINSINLENGLERFERVVPLVKKYGAAVVVGLIDEQGMALTRQRKLEVAERCYDLLVKQYDLAPVDIIFDPLTFPVGTGDRKYLGSAVETIEGLRLIKKRFPECKTLLGISNVSFGLPAAGREVLNAVFLYLNTLAGLDYAIVNTEKLVRYASIPEQEKKLAEDLLLNTSEQALKDFIDYYREKKPAALTFSTEQILPLEQRLAEYIVQGSREGLESDLREALNRYSPLEIINGPLLEGMERVGTLFNQNKLIVAEVLQSAEVMKAAVSFLEKYMTKAEHATRGKVLLATVKGDVHDIGKNLVGIILSNNGYKVVDLGVKVDSEQLISASKAEKPDAIGLSGLLVKSVQQMRITAQDLRESGINVPLVLGGAALTKKFTEERIAPVYAGPVLYAHDAMEGLSLLNDLLAGKAKTGLNRQISEQEAEPSRIGFAGKDIDAVAVSSATVSWDHPVYRPKTLARQVLWNYPLQKLKAYLDMPFILRRYLGGQRQKTQADAQFDAQIEATRQSYRDKEKEFRLILQDFIDEIVQKELIKAHGVYAFFPAYSEGNSIFVIDPDSRSAVLEEFTFLRQPKSDGLCLADYIRPLWWQPTGGQRSSGQNQPQDYIGLFVLTTGLQVSELAKGLQDKGEYLKSFLLQVLALEFAEAFAEEIHRIMREIWGLEDAPDLTAADLRKRRYQGIRVSPGYAICPQIEYQQKIFRLLKPEEIGLSLTENFMMEPEASISALVFSHPQAKIFTLTGDS